MKFILVGSCLFLLYLHVVTSEGSNSTITKKTSNSKEVEKLSYPKKVSSIKKNIAKTSVKKIANITEKFKDLSADDLTFIKELDKQFQLYGGKVKIKIENKNATAVKTSKRTIDGELGYGYAHNGYQYDPPKYMFYPYSQKNIGGNAANYFATGDAKTDVSIEPSYSYELKSQTYVTHNEPQIDVPKVEIPPQHTQHLMAQQYFGQKQQYEEPVIVLRIPGPAKYATHLQMLLQKYLEIRAAQYLHILEEAEQRNHQQQQQQHHHHHHQQQQQHHHHQLQQLDYGQENNIISENPIQHVEQLHHDQQNVVTTSSQQYPEIDNVYHNYKNKYSSHHQQVQQAPPAYYTPQQTEEQYVGPQYEHQVQHQQQQQHQQQHVQYQHQEQEQPILYYTHQQQYAQPEGPPANTYHQVYLVAMIPHQQADYEAPQTQMENQQPIYVQEDQTHQNEAGSSTLPLAENNPRPSHTRVVFSNKQEHSTHDYQMYALPSIKPNERHAPKSTPNHHQDFVHHQQQQQQQHEDYQNYNTADASSAGEAAITQRPYNYHAHNVKAQARERLANSRRAATRVKENDKGLQKIREYVRDKLGAEPGSVEEYKTYVDG